MSIFNVSRREFGLVRDIVEVLRLGKLTLMQRSDLRVDPAPFIGLISEDRPGETMQPEKGRFVKKLVCRDAGSVVSKRFHYHRTYRRKQRLFLGYRWQHAHGPSQFVRSLYAFLRGHRVVEPLLAVRRPVSRLRQESLLVTRRVNGISLRDMFLDPGRDMAAKLNLFRQGLCALKSMHEDGIAFGDAQTRHQILDEQGRLWWLDFDKMAICGAGYGKTDRDLRRFLSSSILRISQSGHDMEDIFEAVIVEFDRTYPLPPIWRKVLITEVRNRMRRMLKRPGFHRL